ncbi:MAG: GNAT family N-acetyltransferase [Kangiellaceae bacterium]|nr:GNAT family N-acetyltransferase [Kangiellaceae bacterium]
MSETDISKLEIPTIVGANILLRPCKASDYEAIRFYRQDEESCRFIRPPESDQRIKEIVEQHCSPWEMSEARWNGLVINFIGQEKVVGEIVFRIEEQEHSRAEIGYRISPECAGKGVCTEACRLLINYLFSELKFHKVVAKCDPENHASYRVMEKVGMQKEAYFKSHFKVGNRWTDQVDYGLLASDWKW